MKIEYHKNDFVGPYNAIFLYETKQDIQPCGRKNRRAQFLCPYCKEKEFNARINEVRKGTVRSCGCFRSISKMKTHTKDIKNQKHGYLTTLYRTSKKAKDNSYLWVCQCECGNITELTTSEFKRINSCGCQKGYTQGENIVANFLKMKNFYFLREYSFDDCLSIKGYKLRFDFYLPKNNCCIEIDGRQHREPVDRFGGETTFNELIQNDNIKNEYCKNNNIKLIRIPYERREFPITETRINQIFQNEGII